MSETGVKETVNTIILGKHGIVYEDREDFPTSIFHKVYKRASELAQYSVESQMRSGGRTGEYEQLDNIITFIGRRGTGKSSSMLSFMESLKKNAEDDRLANEAYRIQVGGRRVRFVGLEWIDASLIEKGEDIFEIILAEMLNEFLKFDERAGKSGAEIEYAARELHQMFESIYKKKLNLKKRNGDAYYYSSESAMASLRDLSGSGALRKDFERLIREYIRVEQLSSGNLPGFGEETFLVVAIDDIDMNMDSGFEILEKIQRYLKVHHLIVLLAVNYEQLLISCEKHFRKLYSGYNGYAAGEKNSYISKIAEEYMEKALPSYMRVYLPSLKKRDYDRERLTRVQLQPEGNPLEMGIKQAMFFMAEKKTKVRYDSQGRKRHFMEPGSLRSLNNQFLFLSALEDPEEGGDSFIETLNHNYRWSMDDLLFRYAFENLPLKERKFFIELSEEDLRRRGEIIVARLLSELGKRKEEELLFTRRERGNASGTFVHEFQEECGIYGYSYGQFLRGLFFLGRERIFDRKLVHAILAMYSLVLTKIFYNYKNELKNGQLRGNNYQVLEELFWGSSAGSWALYLVPKLSYGTAGQGRLFTGAVRGIRMEGQVLPASEETRQKLAEIMENHSGAGFEQEIADAVTAMTPQLILLLFLTGFRPNEPSDCAYELAYQQSSGIARSAAGDDKDAWLSKDKEGIVFGPCRADYNVLNLIDNIFMFDKAAGDFIQAVARLLQKGMGKKQREDMGDLVGRVKELLYHSRSGDGTRDCFCREMHEWTKRYGGMAVPIYSTDIYYNMLKRLARQCRERAAADIEGRQLFGCLRGLLADIREHLKASDEYYSLGSREGTSGPYTEAFDSCPAVRELIDGGNNGMEGLYNSFVESLIRGGGDENRKMLFYEGLGSVLY